MRYKANMPQPSQEEMKTIGAHWGAFIGELAQSGKLIGAGSIEEATEIVKKCPIYEMDGSVEVRSVINSQR